MRLVVFDLDGTITYRDTLLPYVTGFLARAHRSRLRMVRVAPTLAAFSVGAADHGGVKSAFIHGTLGGVTRGELAAWTDEFVPWVITQGSRPAALAALKAHREAGDRLVLMSASTDLYVPQIGAALGFEQSICTGVAFDPADRLDGALTTANRRGPEKVRCFQALRQQYPGIATVAYGNSASDLAHLVLADSPRLVNASPRTIRRAAALGITPFATWTT
jgi:phosphatidylglycerophosphatase C